MNKEKLNRMKLKKNSLLKFKRQLDEKKLELQYEVGEVNLFILHAHNIYNLDAYNRDDNDGVELHNLRNQLFRYSIDHIKKYKIINEEIDEIKRKIELIRFDIEKNEKKVNKLIK